MGKVTLSQACPQGTHGEAGRNPGARGDQGEATAPAPAQPRSLMAKRTPSPWQRPAHLHPYLNRLVFPLISPQRRLLQWKRAPRRLPRPLPALGVSPPNQAGAPYRALTNQSRLYLPSLCPFTLCSLGQTDGVVGQ